MSKLRRIKRKKINSYPSTEFECIGHWDVYPTCYNNKFIWEIYSTIEIETGDIYIDSYVDCEIWLARAYKQNSKMSEKELLVETYDTGWSTIMNYLKKEEAKAKGENIICKMN